MYNKLRKCYEYFIYIVLTHRRIRLHYVNRPASAVCKSCVVCTSTDMCTKADKSMYTTASQFDLESLVIFSRRINYSRSITRKSSEYFFITINYDDNTYYLLRIIRWKVIERRQNMCPGTKINVFDIVATRAPKISDLKLYCSYLYTRPCMINHIWGLKQLWLQVNGHAWFHLQRLRWPVRNGKGAKNSKWKYMSPVGFEPTPRQSTTGKLQRLRLLGHAG